MTTDLPAVTALVLAAGQGTRMKGAEPKVLHTLCGRPMLHWVIDAAFAAGARDVVVVVGHGRDEVEASLAAAFGERVRTAVQPVQRGTGDAVRCALSAVRADAELLLVLCGDTPLLEADELSALRAATVAAGVSVAVLTCDAPEPAGYGRILRGSDGRVLGIREHHDASPEERALREVNSGVYLVRAAYLREAILGLSPNNAQGELYFTDLVALAAAGGGSVLGFKAPSADSLAGVNDRAQLAAAEDILYGRIADRLRRAGATIRSSARIDAGVVVEPEARIEHAVVLRGATRVGAGAVVDVGSVLTDVEVASGAMVKPYTVGSSAFIGEKAQIGPFSHLRAESHIEAEAHVGNFVETKKTRLRRGAKANHLAYLGDGDIGEGANVGAGTIFCNYDGFRKHKTEIGPGAFIGSDSQLVAPIRVGANAYVATGTTVTCDVPDDALAIARVRQENKEGYAPRLRARMKAAKKDG